ncbi:hypothetical protein NUSPORA_01459 [Nucleospora cyclopteri]
MAVLYTQIVNPKSRKLLTGSYAMQGRVIEEDYDILTEQKQLIAKALSADNSCILESEKIYSKPSESSRFLFFLKRVEIPCNNAEETDRFCLLAIITDSRSTNKTISVYTERIQEQIFNNYIKFDNTKDSCYGNDVKIESISNEFNKEERMINANSALQSAHTNLVENLDNLIHRGENINNLKSMAENLRFESEFMSKKVRDMKMKEQIEMYKTYAIIVVVILLLLYIFVWRK